MRQTNIGKVSNRHTDRQTDRQTHRHTTVPSLRMRAEGNNEDMFLYVQVLYGDHVPMVHHSGFLRGQLEQVLPVAMATSRRRVEFERRVLTQHSKVSNNISQCDDSQVTIT